MLFVYGGEGEQVDMSDTCAYLLDSLTLDWRRVVTLGDFEDGQKGHPGPRSLHVSTTRRNVRTGSEDVIIFGGFSPSSGQFGSQQSPRIFDMVPYCLCLDTMQVSAHHPFLPFSCTSLPSLSVFSLPLVENDD